jgi:hypothetical protein
MPESLISQAIQACKAGKACLESVGSVLVITRIPLSGWWRGDRQHLGQSR